MRHPSASDHLQLWMTCAAVYAHLPLCRYPNTSEDLRNPIRVTHFGYHTGGRQHNPWFKHQWDCFDVHR